MQRKIEIDIECPACGGTGVYVGLAEKKGAGVVCYKCGGTGCFHFLYRYNEFKGKKEIKGVDRVYLTGMGYVVGTGKINYEGVGEIDMDKEGVSYQEFLRGKTPRHIKKLGCPVLADQAACDEIKNFMKDCRTLNGGWIFKTKRCKQYPNKHECWERFEKKEGI